MSDSGRASLRRLRIRVQASNQDELARSFKANLSPKGLFIKLSKDVQLGEPVAVELSYVGDELALSGEGSVGYVGSVSADGLRGVSFDLEWDAASLELVQDILGRPSLMPDGARAATGRPSEHPLSVESVAPPPPSVPNEDPDTERAPTLRTPAFDEMDTPHATGPGPVSTSESSDVTERIPSPHRAEPVEDRDDSDDETLESPTPDFDAIRAAQLSPTDGEDPLTPPTREPSKVWGWFRKRFSSTTKDDVSNDDPSRSEEE